MRSGRRFNSQKEISSEHVSQEWLIKKKKKEKRKFIAKKRSHVFSIHVLLKDLAFPLNCSTQ